MTLTAAQWAYRRVKESIITTRLPPGAVIDINQLQAELGYGRTPIREALKLLEREQLVTVSPRRGIFVADVSITDLHQVHEVRMELEPLCTILAVERRSPSELTALRQLVREADAGERQGDPLILLGLDRRFHLLLAAACHNRLLELEVERLYNLSQRIWHYCAGQFESNDVFPDAFRAILAATEVGDQARAGEAMRQHIYRFYNSIKRTL